MRGRPCGLAQHRAAVLIRELERRVVRQQEPYRLRMSADGSPVESGLSVAAMGCQIGSLFEQVLNDRIAAMSAGVEESFRELFLIEEAFYQVEAAKRCR